jgi:starch phosphorylase
MENELSKNIAYFSMEIAIVDGIPTYSGGLGVLAGDTIRSAADLSLPMVAVTLLYRKGYFSQSIDAKGKQVENPVDWDPSSILTDVGRTIFVAVEGRRVEAKVWRYDVESSVGASVPVFFLDTNLESNSSEDRALTDRLYGGDSKYRLSQEIVLGIGGVRCINELGYQNIQKFHMNEGHASFLTLELLDETCRQHELEVPTDVEIAAVRSKCVFTTHTPVKAGHDTFPLALVDQVLGRRDVCHVQSDICENEVLNMTHLGFSFSNYINGVARKHGQISREMFANYTIHSITNGVHAGTWTSPAFQKLFDTHIPGWRKENECLRYVVSVPRDEIEKAHSESKARLIDAVREKTSVALDPEVFTIGFARRMTRYKRAGLIFSDIERLKAISRKVGKIQFVFAGKAHPKDEIGKELIKSIYQAAEELAPDVALAYVPNYDMEFGGLITSGSDIWLNTPEPPLEASGTSGMKAALNGVPSLSSLDGWWIEGCIEGVTGWSISNKRPYEVFRQKLEDFKPDAAKDAENLYSKLELEILPLYYAKDKREFADVRANAIALNGSFFNTERMMKEYVARAYTEISF